MILIEGSMLYHRVYICLNFAIALGAVAAPTGLPSAATESCDAAPVSSNSARLDLNIFETCEPQAPVVSSEPEPAPALVAADATPKTHEDALVQWLLNLASHVRGQKRLPQTIYT